MPESLLPCILSQQQEDVSDDCLIKSYLLGKSVKFAPHLNVPLQCQGLTGIFVGVPDLLD